MNSKVYHLEELNIALSANDPRRVMPIVSGEHKRILDVGCGAGQTLIASHLSPDVVAVGVDRDFAALHLGKQLGTHIHFVCAAGERLPFVSGCFDLVISRVSLPYMHIPKALAEIARVIKPCGNLWIVLHPFPMVWRELVHSFRKLNVVDVLFRLYVLANGLAFHIASKQFRFPFGRHRCESFQTGRGISRALYAAGFADIEIRRERFFVVSAKKWSVGQLTPVPTGVSPS